jgi:predicted nucleotidyltransferase
MSVVKTFILSFLEKEILKRLSSIIEKEMPEASQIIVFGSRARGGSDENSDLDVAVIIDAPAISKEIWERIWDIKWRVLESFNSEEFPLSLSPITLNDFISRDFGLEEAIKTEGIRIWERTN